jgi:hypothetical protein
MLIVQDVLFLFFIFLITVAVIAAMYDWVKSKENLKKFDKFVEDVAIGKKYISYIILDSDDPFEEKEPDVYVIVKGVKRNDKGDTWVKIELQNGGTTTMPVKELYYNFYEDESTNQG